MEAILANLLKSAGVDLNEVFASFKQIAEVMAKLQNDTKILREELAQVKCLNEALIIHFASQPHVSPTSLISVQADEILLGQIRRDAQNGSGEQSGTEA